MAHPFIRHFCAVFLSTLCFISILKFNNNKITTTNQNLTDADYDEEIENEEKQPARLQLDNLKSFRGATNETIYFLGLFELSTGMGWRRESESEVSAARLAVEHVNGMGVLPGYTLRLLINDTKVRDGVWNFDNSGNIYIWTCLMYRVSYRTGVTKDNFVIY